jgi:hypothetical protein
LIWANGIYSMTGQAAVMSLTTGNYANKHNQKVKEHDCRRNHSDSSKALEPAAACC